MSVSAQVTTKLARRLVEDYGREAETAALDRAEALAAYGQWDAAEVWARVFGILHRQGLRHRAGSRPAARDFTPQQSRC